MTSAVWNPVKGYEGAYEVSNDGRVRSLPRTISHPVNGPTRRQGKSMKLRLSLDCYMVVGLCKDGVETDHRVHRLVAEAFMSVPDGMSIDHIDGCPWNNSLSNLRVCTHQQNMRNQGVRATNTSGVTGVSFDTKSEKWRANVSVGGRWTSLGFFDSKEDAVAARLSAAASAYGEYLRAATPLPTHPPTGEAAMSALFSNEHYALMTQFEQQFKGRRLDREDKSYWPKGIVYQDGAVNDLFLAFRRGVAYGEAIARSTTPKDPQ